MSKQTKIEYLLAANTKQFVTGFGKAKTGVQAFNKATGNGTKVIGQMRSQMLQLIGAAAGLATLSQANQIMLDASAAGFNLEASLTAANRQFDVGPAEQWQSAISRLSGELQVYTKTALQNAAAKTVDMTKRLGLSALQMENVISMTGNLAAGKTHLEDGVERVTAALRGEAEASEFLGLTLNESYVKAWHEAHNAHGIAWKDLSDLEKAQVRYNVLVEQAAPLQGRAAESVDTYAGALALIRTVIVDNIAQNEGLVEAMGQVGAILRDNADDIADTVSALATGAAKIIEFVAANHEMLIGLAKWSLLFMAGFKALNLLYKGFKGVNAAMTVMTGTNLLPWFKSLIGGATKSGGAVRALAGGFGKLGLAVGTFYSAYKVGEWVTMRKHIKGVADALKDLEAAKKQQGDISAEIGDTVGMPGATYDELMQAKKDGLIQQDTETGDWSKVPGQEKNTPPPLAPDLSALPANQIDESGTGRPLTKKDLKPGDADYQGTEAYQSWQDIMGAGLTMDAPEDGMTKAELENFAQYKKDQAGNGESSAWGAADQEKNKALNEQINAAWNKVESSDESGIDNITRQLQNIAGNHQVRDVQMEDSGRSASPTPEKTVKLEFQGGSLAGSQSDVDALLGNLESAGMRT